MPLFECFAPGHISIEADSHEEAHKAFKLQLTWMAMSDKVPTQVVEVQLLKAADLLRQKEDALSGPDATNATAGTT